MLLQILIQIHCTIFSSGVPKVKPDIKLIIVNRETLQQDISNNFPDTLSIAPEGDQEEEGSLNTDNYALILGDNQQADAVNCHLWQKFQRTTNGVENCTDADCLFTAVHCNWQMYLLAILQIILCGN